MHQIDSSLLTEEERKQITARLGKKARAKQATEFVEFCRSDELFGKEKPATHHEMLCAHLQLVERGEIERLMIFMPPGSAKSTYTSVRFASWYLGRHPEDSIIQACHTARLAQRFGRKVRNLVGSHEFNKIFPRVGLNGDNQDRGDWSTNYSGEYFAVGMAGALPGRRANGILIDDPIKGIKEADSETMRDNVWDTYVTDVRSRLKVGDERAWIVIINTRWHVDDPCGRILPDDWDHKSGFVTAKDGEQWYVLNLPMEAEEQDPLRRKPGEILWPEWFAKRPDWLEREKVIQGTRRWNALYQGHPTTEEGAILKSSFWRKWPEKQPPVVEYIVQSIDGAFEEDEENDYSARTTWAVFDIFHAANAKILQAYLQGKKKHEVQRYHAILLEAWRGKVPFSAFKRNVIDGFNEYQPDRLLIEKKASGHSLIQELRKGSLPVKAVLPDHSKKSRAHAAEIPFEQGCVWYMDRDWVKPVIKECAEFPNGEYDDWVDTVTQALIWLRRTYHLEFKDEDEGATPKPPQQPPQPTYG